MPECAVARMQSGKDYPSYIAYLDCLRATGGYRPAQVNAHAYMDSIQRLQRDARDTLMQSRQLLATATALNSRSWKAARTVSKQFRSGHTRPSHEPLP